MSNPAVIKLQQNNIGKSRVWLDDNFGESIHIHIDDIRVDLTVDEFEQIYHDIADAINAMVMVNGFDCNKIDPVYLEVMLWRDLLHLREVRIDKVNLGELLAPGRNGISPLPESRAVKALKGDVSENTGNRLSHHIGQTSEDRLSAMLNSVKKNGYPMDDNYIILYGDDNIIRDGQHRAACLYFLYGDIEIPVLRFYFDNYAPENVVLTKKKYYRVAQKVKNHLREMRTIKGAYKEIRNVAKKIKHQQREKSIANFKKSNNDELQNTIAVIENK